MKRIWEAVVNQKTTRSGSFEGLCGCSIQELISHIESQWVVGMDWSNYTHDGWHIDHVRPCSSFNLDIREQQRVCFNWRNLSPLWGSKNSSKNASYDAGDETRWIERMRRLGYGGELFELFP